MKQAASITLAIVLLTGAAVLFYLGWQELQQIPSVTPGTTSEFKLPDGFCIPESDSCVITHHAEARLAGSMLKSAEGDVVNLLPTADPFRFSAGSDVTGMLTLIEGEGDESVAVPVSYDELISLSAERCVRMQISYLYRVASAVTVDTTELTLRDSLLKMRPCATETATGTDPQLIFELLNR
ncbi:MAG: hypothetical protein TR69_WS6001000579 [candidate division WS6 bacterium OLB20]|uniref:Uncharacterized protein n=1 Tax=candidate division WS6 bacterium OLB20 TaxID=1617426 RepID=A0A136LY46_9BACT|nr:MAG: hypothetical protein TR69_WS6001000579 [candidate division WS6 bacterium OLB20]